MKAKSALTLALAAGMCGTASANVSKDIAKSGLELNRQQKTKMVGHIYYKVATGEMVFTPAKEYFANKTRNANIRAFGDDINGDGADDYWVNTNQNPCGITVPTPSYSAFSPDVSPAGLDTASFAGTYQHFKSETPNTDILVESLTFSFWTDVLDTDTDGDDVGDGNTGGTGLQMTFWDAEDLFAAAGSSNCTFNLGPGFSRTEVATYILTGIPGPLSTQPGFIYGFFYTLDLTGGLEMELLDSDGVGPTNGAFNPFITADADSDTFSDADINQDGDYDIAMTLLGIQPSGTGPGTYAYVGYSLSAPGVSGDTWQNTWDGLTPTADGDDIPNYVNRDDTADPTANPNGYPTVAGATDFDHSIVEIDSIHQPAARPRAMTTFYDLDNDPGTDELVAGSGVELYYGGLTPFPSDGQIGSFTCGGMSDGGVYGFGSRVDVDNDGTAETFVGGLNCEIDDVVTDVDGSRIAGQDGIPDGRPWTAPFIALSGALPPDCICDLDGSGVLNLDDLDAFIAAFLAGDLAADLDGNNMINLDDLDAFIACFLAGCP